MKLIEVIGPEKYFLTLILPTCLTLLAMILMELIPWLWERSLARHLWVKYRGARSHD